MHPIQAMTTGDTLSQLVARVTYGVLSATEALAKEGLTPCERKELAVLLADELAYEQIPDEAA